MCSPSKFLLQLNSWTTDATIRKQLNRAPFLRLKVAFYLNSYFQRCQLIISSSAPEIKASLSSANISTKCFPTEGDHTLRFATSFLIEAPIFYLMKMNRRGRDTEIHLNHSRTMLEECLPNISSISSKVTLQQCMPL